MNGKTSKYHVSIILCSSRDGKDERGEKGGSNEEVHVVEEDLDGNGIAF
jgi:hypothetical protein